MLGKMPKKENAMIAKQITWTITGTYEDEETSLSETMTIEAEDENDACTFFRAAHPDLMIDTIKADQITPKMQGWSRLASINLRRVIDTQIEIDRMQRLKADAEIELEDHLFAIVREAIETLPEDWEDHLSDLFSYYNIGQIDYEPIVEQVKEEVARKAENDARKQAQHRLAEETFHSTL